MSKQNRSGSKSEVQATPRPGRPARGTTTGRPLLVAFDLLGRRWALRILWELREEHLGFRALQERCEGMSSSVLRDRLAELTGAGILETDEQRRYGLSAHGRGLIRALAPLSAWAEMWAAEATSGA
jgi:DNA-binding HxlR family transcriptional regulator